MYAAATTHLPHPYDAVSRYAVGEHADPSRWYPDLRRADDRSPGEVGAAWELAIPLGGTTEVVALTTRDVVRGTVTASGTTSSGDAVDLRLSVSPWDGGTAVVVSVDVDGPDRPFVSWGLTRRLETALVRLAGELATARSAVGRPRP